MKIGSLDQGIKSLTLSSRCRNCNFPKLFIHIIWQDFYFKKLWVWLKIGYPKRSSPRININPPCLDWKSFWHSGETLIFFTSFYSQCSWPILDMFIVKSPKSSHVQRGSLVTTSPAHPSRTHGGIVDGALHATRDLHLGSLVCSQLLKAFGRRMGKPARNKDLLRDLPFIPRRNMESCRFTCKPIMGCNWIIPNRLASNPLQQPINSCIFDGSIVEPTGKSSRNGFLTSPHLISWPCQELGVGRRGGNSPQTTQVR